MPISTAPAPPRAPAKRTQAKPPATQGTRKDAREQSLSDTGKMIGLFLCMRGAYADAGAIAQHGPGLARETALLAESNPRIASVVDYLTEAGPYMGIIVVALPLALQLAANHGRIDASKMPPGSGVLPPEILEAKVKAEMAKQAEEYRKDIERESSSNGSTP